MWSPGWIFLVIPKTSVCSLCVGFESKEMSEAPGQAGLGRGCPLGIEHEVSNSEPETQAFTP